MRNWNLGVRFPWPAPTDIQPTYEELKPWTNYSVRKKISKVSSLPMRNWNQSGGLLEQDVSGVSSLPMRNWNPYEQVLFFRDGGVSSLPMRNWNSCSFRSRAYYHPYPAYLWGIETLLKVVLSIFSNLYPAYLWGIETNAAGSVFALPDYVSSLPMRNWNRRYVDFVLPLFTYPAYLWGIETPPGLLWYQLQAPYPAYLWGIET